MRQVCERKSLVIFLDLVIFCGAWGGVVVKELRY